MGAFAPRTPDNLPESQETKTLRAIERMAIYGETSLDISYAQEATGSPQFTLGIVAKFRDYQDNVVQCRYVRFMDGIPADAVTRPVGQLATGNPYEATYLPASSHQGMILGIAMRAGPVPRPCYGWVQIDGIRDLPDAVAFAFGDTVYWHSNGSITDNAVSANGVVGIALGEQRIYVHPWFGQPNEAMPPYLIDDITGLQTSLDNLADAIADAIITAGDVDGPAGGVLDGEIAVYDGVTGKLIRSSGGAKTSDFSLIGHNHNTLYYTQAQVDTLLGFYQPALGYTAENAANKDIDSGMAANSDVKYPSQKAVKTALALKANLASPALTGAPTAPTAVAGTNTTQLATTEFATTADNLKANLAGPTFTGVVTVPDGSFTLAKLANATGLSVVGRSAAGAGANADLVAVTAGHVLRLSGTLGFGTLVAGSFATGPGIVTFAMMDNGTALSVDGRSANTDGVRAAITAAANGNVLRRAANVVGFGQIDLTDAANAVSGILASGNGGTGNGFTKFTGPATAEKTFTLPDATGKIHTNQAGNADAVVALVDAANPALDASLGNVFKLIATADRTIAAPTNAVSGQKIIIRFNASGGARTLSLDAIFRFGTDITALTATNSGSTDYVGCIYNGTDTKWDVVAYSKGY